MQCWSMEPSAEGVVCWVTLATLPRQTHSILHPAQFDDIAVRKMIRHVAAEFK